MNISKEQFNSYVKVQESGVTNMWDVNCVSRLSRLSQDQVMYIMDHYDELSKTYSN